MRNRDSKPQEQKKITMPESSKKAADINKALQRIIRKPQYLSDDGIPFLIGFEEKGFLVNAETLAVLEYAPETEDPTTNVKTKVKIGADEVMVVLPSDAKILKRSMRYALDQNPIDDYGQRMFNAGEAAHALREKREEQKMGLLIPLICLATLAASVIGLLVNLSK